MSMIRKSSMESNHYDRSGRGRRRIYRFGNAEEPRGVILLDGLSCLEARMRSFEKVILPAVVYLESWVRSDLHGI